MTDFETAIPAATVLLLRDNPELEVLMVQRHADIGFAGGAMVFPGGRVDPGDANDEWREHADGLPEDPVMAAAMVAAARESFEEAGILLARKGDAMVDGDVTLALNDQRAAVEADDALFLDLIKREGMRLACDCVSLFAHWVPPPAMHKRFDTLFFAAAMPPGQEAREDGNEATEAVWLTPAAALAACEDGSRKMIFPTSRNVELLGVSQSVDEALAFAKERKIVQVQPKVVERDGAQFLTIPDDLGYPVTAERLETAFRQ